MSAGPADVVDRFNAAMNARDVDAVMALMSHDCVFDGTAPPDGERFDGATQVRQAWEALFASAREAGFSTEEMITAEDRVVVRWRYDWIDNDGRPGHIRGIDLFHVRNGLITEKLAYVKG